jgi:hypothetical protein
LDKENRSFICFIAQVSASFFMKESFVWTHLSWDISPYGRGEIILAQRSDFVNGCPK